MSAKPKHYVPTKGGRRAHELTNTCWCGPTVSGGSLPAVYHRTPKS